MAQIEYLKAQGLQPHHRLVDIGCGPFRAGRHFIDYLDPGSYYAVDANHGLIHAGYDVELSDEQRDRLPITNLRAHDRFDVDFGVPFGFAIAQSVFTHVSLNHILPCLHPLALATPEGGEFHATFFVRPQSAPVDAIIPSKRDKPFLNEQNVFWHYSQDVKWAAGFAPWRTPTSATGATRPIRRWRGSCASRRPRRGRPLAPARSRRRFVAGVAGRSGTLTRRVPVRAPETIVGLCQRLPAPARPPAS